jgi:hypothetical protein
MLVWYVCPLGVSSEGWGEEVPSTSQRLWEGTRKVVLGSRSGEVWKEGGSYGVQRGRSPALTVNLDELIEAGEDVLQLLQREEAPFSHGLVEEVVQHTQHSYVGCLCHQQLCGPPKQDTSLGRAPALGASSEAGWEEAKGPMG